ncbi:23S rRNA (adenine(1618)-N(6))-methyltransferase RlmF [Undibacterium fentianense]|nr:23S rRNA (adenine(1618)-N(6))-methyltransferase RlmF [Undibacterium fentianense]
MSTRSSHNKPKAMSPSKRVVEDNPSSNTSTLFHPRNRHQGKYDFEQLIEADKSTLNDSLASFIYTNIGGEISIHFSDPKAVKALNRALLRLQYGVSEWDIPEDYLCPPVPGRADYIHHLADLLIANNHGKSPKKSRVQVLDIGTGANGIYPLIGASSYQWQFVASDINPDSIANVDHILKNNPTLSTMIQTRLQIDRKAFFKNIIRDDEWFDLSMCNPPFHDSAAEAQKGTQRKWNNLGMSQQRDKLNFGGQDTELWCDGGELTFIQNMIKESQVFASRCFWFTSLVSKASHLPEIKVALKQANVQQSKIIDMQQGQKQSRLVAWSFLNPIQQAAWAKMRW